MPSGSSSAVASRSRACSSSPAPPSATVRVRRWASRPAIRLVRVARSGLGHLLGVLGTGGALPRLGGDAGTAGTAVDGLLGGAGVVPVHVGRRQALQDVDFDEEGGSAHGMTPWRRSAPLARGAVEDGLMWSGLPGRRSGAVAGRSSQGASGGRGDGGVEVAVPSLPEAAGGVRATRVVPGPQSGADQVVVESDSGPVQQWGEGA